ncbi:MAG: hypothetical protein ACP5SF_00730 [Thermoplasmata archaeon]
MESKDWRILLYSILIGIVILLIAFMVLDSLILIYPIIMFYLFHRMKIWQTKKRAKLGTIAILIVSLVSLIYYPIGSSSLNQYYETYHISGSNQTIVKNVSFTIYPSNMFYLNITTTKTVHSHLSLSYINESTGNTVPIMNFSSNSTLENGNYITTFTINVKNLSSGIYISNVSINNGSPSVIVFAPRMLSSQEFNSIVNRIALFDTIYLFIYVFLMAEIFFLAIIFGAHTMRRGKQVISKQT